MGEAQPLLGKATSTLQGPLDFWSTLFKGDRGAMSQLLGPELDAVAARDLASRRAVSQFSPRGSTLNSRLGELDATTQGDINRMFLSLRPEAADRLTELAQLLFGSGTALFNSSTGASGNALGNLLQNRSLNLNERQTRQAGNSNIFRAANFLWGGAG